MSSQYRPRERQGDGRTREMGGATRGETGWATPRSVAVLNGHAVANHMDNRRTKSKTRSLITPRFSLVALPGFEPGFQP